MNLITPKIQNKIREMFPNNPEEPAEMILELCNEYMWQNKKMVHPDRICAALLKCSNGEIDDLYSAIELANRDWRDLLVAAGFARDTYAHEKWLDA